MKYQLPQFIETEVKLVGPFTLKQFLWIAAGASMLFVLFFIIQGFWFIVLALPIASASLALAFVKVQGTSLVNYTAYMLSFYISPKKYLFHNEENQSLTNNTPHA